MNLQDGINHDWRHDKILGHGCVKRIMRLIGSWERRSLIVDFGRRDGGQDGRMGDVINISWIGLDLCMLGYCII